MKLERLFTVRGYELDRTGALPPTELLRYMEHLRWEGLRKGGCLEGMFTAGRRIVVRQQRLELRQRVGFGEELVVGLAIARIGRTSVQMVHDVTRNDGTPVARADLFAVQLDAHGKPAPVGDDVRALALEPGAPQVVPVLTEEEPEGAFVHELAVRPHEIDMLQHVNHSYYAEYFEDVRVIAAEAGAYGGGSKAAAGPARVVAVDYVRSALPHDALSVTTWALAGQGALAFVLRRGAEVLCRGRIDVQVGARE